MRNSCRWRIHVGAVLMPVVLATAITVLASAQETPLDRQVASPAATIPSLTDEEIEQFLKKARIVKTKGTKKGITGSVRATLSDGRLTHDAHVQVIDEEKAKFETQQGVEFNFRDSWRFNVAGYRLDRLIGLNMVPVSVPRVYGSSGAAYTWWIDDVMADEEERLKKKMQPPDLPRWNEQMQLVRLFDQLIYNVDRNLGNLVITSDWRIWAIDHTRGFRRYHDLKSAQNITTCDRQVLERLQALDLRTLRTTMKDFLGEFEIQSMLARRDKIVARLASLGPGALFDRRTLQTAHTR